MIPRELCRPKKRLKHSINAQRHLYESTYFSSLTFSIVSESGASIYSASDLAKKEMPELDISLRGAGEFDFHEYVA